ncbi:MAG: hypothetical protein P8Z76_13790 [Alphaproteobacteria bacterium]
MNAIALADVAQPANRAALNDWLAPNLSYSPAISELTIFSSGPDLSFPVTLSDFGLLSLSRAAFDRHFEERYHPFQNNHSYDLWRLVGQIIENGSSQKEEFVHRVESVINNNKNFSEIIEDTFSWSSDLIFSHFIFDHNVKSNSLKKQIGDLYFSRKSRRKILEDLYDRISFIIHSDIEGTVDLRAEKHYIFLGVVLPKATICYSDKIVYLLVFEADIKHQIHSLEIHTGTPPPVLRVVAEAMTMSRRIRSNTPGVSEAQNDQVVFRPVDPADLSARKHQRYPRRRSISRCLRSRHSGCRSIIRRSSNVAKLEVGKSQGGQTDANATLRQRRILDYF